MAIICLSLLTYARQRPITATQPATRVDTTCWQLFRPVYGPFLFFCCGSCQITSLLTGWKNFLYFRRPPRGLRPVAFATSATWLIRYWLLTNILCTTGDWWRTSLTIRAGCRDKQSIGIIPHTAISWASLSVVVGFLKVVRQCSAKVLS